MIASGIGVADEPDERVVVRVRQPGVRLRIPDLSGAGLATNDVARDLGFLGVVRSGVDDVDHQLAERVGELGRDDLVHGRGRD